MSCGERVVTAESAGANVAVGAGVPCAHAEDGPASDAAINSKVMHNTAAIRMRFKAILLIESQGAEITSVANGPGQNRSNALTLMRAPQCYQLIFTARSQQFSIRAKSNAPYRRRRGRECGFTLTTLHVPHDHGLVVAARGQERTIWTECQAFHLRTVPRHCKLAIIRLSIPQND